MKGAPEDALLQGTSLGLFKFHHFRIRTRFDGQPICLSGLGCAGEQFFHGHPLHQRLVPGGVGHPEPALAQDVAYKVPPLSVNTGPQG